MITKVIKRVLPLWLALALLSTTAVVAQDEFDEMNVFELSPFVVESDADEGYRATATLAGTRIRTNLRDLATPLSVVTKQFLEDTGATDNQSLLVYTTNTEVGGLYGNFAGVGNTQGIGEGRNLNAPSSNTRVRGLDAADNTRNYFLTDIPWDGYNVDRVDLQRGPNSILFGVGSPAGIINTSTTVPVFANSGRLENRIGSHGSTRHSIDYNRVLVEDMVAIRVSGLSKHAQFKQKPAFEKDRRGFAAITIKPDWFGESVSTTINANYERGEIRANRPRILPPVDLVTPWWTGMGQRVYDPFWSWAFAAQQDRGNGTLSNRNPHINQPWLSTAMDGGMSGGIKFFYENGSSMPYSVRSMGGTHNWGINEFGEIDRGIGSFPFSRLQAVAGFNEYSRNADADARAKGLPSPFPGAGSNFYKDKHMDNPNVFDFYNILLDGDNKREWSDFEAYNFSVSQTYFGNRLGWELVYDYQDYYVGGAGLFGGRVSIGIDVNSHRQFIPPTYPDAVPESLGGGVPLPSSVVGGERNPDAGRAYIGGEGPSAWENRTTRENLRFTAFGEVHGSDFFDDGSLLAKLIGRNVFTGLVSRDERSFHNEGWRQFAMDMSFAKEVDASLAVNGQGRNAGYFIYLTDDLRGVSSPWNLNLRGVESYINPARGPYSMTFFDSRWNATDVDPSAPYILPVTGGESVQAENWENYVGVRTMNVGMLNASQGDLEQLLTSASKRDEVLNSVGLTWQGYWWNGMIVPTVGWRRDEIETWGLSGSQDPVTNLVGRHFDNPKTDSSFISKGETTTWGVVFHTDQILEDALPYNTNISLFYNNAENFQAANRVGFSGAELPSPSGKSTDYGIVINMLDDKLTFKATWYKTSVENADIGSSSPLGGGAYRIWANETWIVAGGVIHDMYWAGDLPGFAWYSNYALADDPTLWDTPGFGNGNPPFSAENINHPSNQALFRSMEAIWQNMAPQSFYDAYGIPINTALAGNPQDRQRMIRDGNWHPNNGIWSVGSSGLVNGIPPTITISQESKGVEFELQFRPVRNWNITVNASKTEASRGDLGDEIVNWIEWQYDKHMGPFGDLRLWWGGDDTIRNYFMSDVWLPYKFQQDAKGQSAPEIRAWRFNVVTNYSFQEGFMRGVNVGGAYRWQDNSILGYQLTDSLDQLDINRPIYGGAEANLDLWVGYQTKVTDKIDWRLQLNLRNVGDKARLIPVSVNPDKSIAAARIAEGAAWELTSTFSF